MKKLIIKVLILSLSVLLASSVNCGGNAVACCMQAASGSLGAPILVAVGVAVGIVGAVIFVGYKIVKHLSPTKKREDRNKKRKAIKLKRKIKRPKLINKKIEVQEESLSTT